MPDRFSFAKLIFLFGTAVVVYQAKAQPCPENLMARDSASNYLEILSPNSDPISIPLPEVQVFPGGKERIYILLPDILTELSTPVIRWNELVLKKPLNSDENWKGSLDRALFYPTHCLPDLDESHFSEANSQEGFFYETENNRVTVQGTVSFAEVDGKQMKLHFNVTDREVPRPLINDLDGKIYSRGSSLTISSGEISYIPTDRLLTGSGFAEGDNLDQRFDFQINEFQGEPGIYVVDEGPDYLDTYFIYKIDGNPETEIFIKKFAINSSVMASNSFFEPVPFQVNSQDLEQLPLLAEMHSSSLLIDPKPVSIELPLVNQAFEGNSPNIQQIRSFTNPPVLNPDSWVNDYTVFFENLPVWNLKWVEEDSADVVKTISLQNRLPETNTDEPGIEQRLSYQQVEKMNEGFMEIFKNFDDSADTTQLKTSILSLFETNDLTTSAGMNDSFEEFLVTTISAFREAEKHALYTGSAAALPALDANALELAPVELQVNTETGLPVSRSFTFKETNIQITYEKDSISLLAVNKNQGQQSIKIPNAGLLDIYQLFGVLSQLPLAEDSQFNLGFFDLMPVEKRTVEEPNQQRLLLLPKYIHASVEVVEKLTYQGTAAIKLAIQFNGLRNPLFPESYEPDFSGTYYVSQSFPHQLIKATFNQGLTLQ
ncbi:hypothetical protein [Cyclobacterium jeungdonense]|uniref:Uncharacterized protein n=1 Tax=Cyclobacterium jeungdonense TaxID=708087 RepID=A0ABT8CCS7_9BACT|nr:hypothetical protein [Cyclobacterium jeungdonense]MDN3690335.1 hypothetical protein [Cyclobacterium jeungdonense]